MHLISYATAEGAFPLELRVGVYEEFVAVGEEDFHAAVYRQREVEDAPVSLMKFGAYDFTRGRCLIWHEGPCNGTTTKAFLKRVREWIGPTTARIVIIWDGAPWHRAKIAQAQAKALGMEIEPLPGYSPDLNPIEGLWKWMREEVTYGYCHKNLGELWRACQAFIDRINKDPLAMVDRLWPKFELDPEIEKLLFSD